MKQWIASPIAPTVPMTEFTADQWEALGRLRACYRARIEFFSPRELAYLRFLRWLYQSGRLDQ
jgi:hypothetical protein